MYAASVALLVDSDLGRSPWDVLHQGLARSFGLTVGAWVTIAGAASLLAWIPLHQRPGIGTLASVLLVGPLIDLWSTQLPLPTGNAARASYLLAGTALSAAGIATYLGAGLGPAPRDGLMIGLAARGVPLRRARTSIELAALITGYTLGGVAGIGTITYAVLIGPLVQAALPHVSLNGVRREFGP